MLGRQVLGGVDGDQRPKGAGVDPADRLAHDRHRAHDQADVDRRRAAFRHQGGQGEGFVLGAHNRLLGEDREAGGEGGLKVSEVQVVGRADHHQVVRPGGEQGRRVWEGAAGIDVEGFQDRQAHRRRVDVPGHLQRPSHLVHGRQHVRDPLAQADDGDAVGLHGQGLRSPRQGSEASPGRQHAKPAGPGPQGFRSPILWGLSAPLGGRIFA